MEHISLSIQKHPLQSGDKNVSFFCWQRSTMLCLFQHVDINPPSHGHRFLEIKSIQHFTLTYQKNDKKPARDRTMSTLARLISINRATASLSRVLSRYTAHVLQYKRWKKT